MALFRKCRHRVNKCCGFSILTVTIFSTICIAKFIWRPQLKVTITHEVHTDLLHEKNLQLHIPSSVLINKDNMMLESGHIARAHEPDSSYQTNKTLSSYKSDKKAYTFFLDRKNISNANNFHSIKIKSGRTLFINMYNPYDVLMPAGDVFGHCGQSYQCKLTKGVDYYKHSKYVMFTGSHIDFDPPPKVSGQIWILYGLEPPVYYRSSLKKWNNLFNWTMTYRRDSDIPYFYGKIGMKRKRKQFKNKDRTGENFSGNEMNIWKTNISRAAWIVSRCVSHSGRQEFVEKLKNHLEVHVYGRCGSMDCPRNQEKKCNDHISQKYTYYLALENSFCRDYITEKSFKIFFNEMNVIPVVRGMLEKQYSFFLPPKSFIDSSVFKTTSNLSQFVKNLTVNKSEYQSYFSWRKYYNPLRNWTSKQTGFCELCIRLHDMNVHKKYSRIYTDIHKWIFGLRQNPICLKAGDYSL